ncbi:MAG: HD domain-containing protein [Elusimicrobiota bacterium]
MNRKEAIELIETNIKTKNLDKHMFAAEACMRRLASHFGEDEDRWSMAGLLHDIDYDITKGDFSRHGVVSAEMLETAGVSGDIIDAIRAHASKKDISSRMEQALYAVDPLTGLIVASTLMHPAKKIGEVDVNFVMNRFKEKRFAAGADRAQIKSCENMGVQLEEFITICLNGMQEIAGEIGL